MSEVTPLSEDGSSTKPSPAVLRAAGILRVVAAANGEPVTLSELADKLRVPRSSASNICAALTQSGLLRRHPGRAGYGLDRGVLELAGAYLSSTGFVQSFHDAVTRLRFAASETVQLAVLDRVDVVYLALHDGEQPVRLTSGVGRRIPATCTATGKALLARLSVNDVKGRFARHAFSTPTPNSVGDVPSLLAQLDVTRRQGYAVDDEETAEGVVCYAVATESLGDHPDSMAVSVTLLKVRDSDELRERLVGDLRMLASHLSHPFSAGSLHSPAS